jgi:hypothetical protein
MDNYLVVATEGNLPKRLVSYLNQKMDGIAGIRHINDAAIAFTCDADLPSVAQFIQRKYRNDEKVVLFEIEAEYRIVAGTMPSFMGGGESKSCRE